MIDTYIQQYLSLIRNGSKVNTYKLAWAKAIVEIATEDPEIQKIGLETIARKIFKYYWNQTIYFDLIQGNNPNRRPEFVTYVRNEIEIYFDKAGIRQPVHFEKIEDKVKLNIPKLVRILKQDVSWRFPKLNGKKIDVYEYKRGGDELLISRAHILSTYSDVLYDSINFKWTQVLETFNNVPRIAKKVRILDFPDIKRNSLTSFKLYLDEANPSKVCFICNQKIINENPAIDHVIPWSFLFSDDIWNLAYVHQSCNSIKSNNMPSENEILKLEERNQRMLDILMKDENLNKKKPFRELELAIEKDYVKKFWVNCKN